MISTSKKANVTFILLCSLVLWLPIALQTGCSSAPAPNSKPKPKPSETKAKLTSHSKMIRALMDVHEESKFDHPFLGRNKIATGEDFYEKSKRTSPPDAFRAARKLAEFELRIGNIQKALDYLKEANALFVENRAYFDKTEEAAFFMDLAVTYFRLGESENCISCADGAACLLPISGKGVHELTTGSTRAIEYLKQVLEIEPDNYSAKWLWNIAAMTLGKFPDGVPVEHRIDANKFKDDIEFPRFKNVSNEKKLDTLGLSGGAVCEDLNGDGFFDIMVSDWNSSTQIRYFENDGKGDFSDKTMESNLKGIFGGLNLIDADYDNDGDIDIFVLRGAWGGKHGLIPNSLLQNDGKGKFTDVTFDVGLEDSRYPTQTGSWADYDLDGDLDLYIGNEEHPCELFQNQGDGTFKDVANLAGVTNDNLFTKAVIWGDFNNDRFPDLYVSNYFKPNRLYKNNQDGTFTDVAYVMDMAGPAMSFTSWFWDFNNDGVQDLFVATYPNDMENYSRQFFGVGKTNPERDLLYQGDGAGGFSEVGAKVGLNVSTESMGANYGDLDNDGYLDFYLGTGAPHFKFLVPNLMYKNIGGNEFKSVTYAGGFGHLQKGHAVAFVDLDNDGDQDVFQVLGGAYPGDQFQNALFENPGNGNNWLKIKLNGTQTNRSGVGARIKLTFKENGKTRSVYRWVNSGGTFGCNPFLQHIGIGKSNKIDLVEVYWPVSDKTQVFGEVVPNQTMIIDESKGWTNETSRNVE